MLFEGTPTVIDAEQWDGTITSYERIETMAVGKVRPPDQEGQPLLLLAGQEGASGWVPVPVGAWVAHWPDDQTDFWPIDESRMREKYRPKVERP